MEMLSARVERVGFLRPIGIEGTDRQMQLMKSRYRVDARHALTGEEAREAGGATDEVKKAIVAAYRELEADNEVVVCAGTDFDLDIDLANELGAPLLVVVGWEGSAEQTQTAVRLARESVEQRGGEVLAVIVNRVPPESLAEVTDAHALPQQPELTYPTVAEVAAATGARPLVDLPDPRQA